MTSAKKIEQWLAGRLAEITGRVFSTIDPAETFASHGIASVELVSLLAELEDWLGVPVDPVMAYRSPSPTALAVDLTGDILTGPGPVEAGHSAGPQVPAGEGGDSGDPIAVVGLACRFPGGADTPDRYWSNLIAGMDTVIEIPASRWQNPPVFDAGRPTSSRYSYTRKAAFLDDVAGFDAAMFGLSPQEAQRTDPQHRLLMELVWEALEDAGMRPDRLAGDRVGLFAGLMDSGQYTQLQRETYGAGVVTDPSFGLGGAPSIAVGRIAHRLDLRGPALTVDTACSSSLVGLHLSAQSLRRRETDVGIVAAASLILHPDIFVQGCAMSMLSHDGRCQTFDTDADGFAMGEGGGAVVLERLSDAMRLGHRVHAVLLGSAVNQDGRSNGLTAPNPASQTAVIRDALSDAGVTAREVSFVEAHGTGTALGDRIELAALGDVFGQVDRDTPLWVGAVKTQVGHLLAAAGMAGLIKTVLALKHGRLPPNLHMRTPNAAVDPDGPVRPALDHSMPLAEPLVAGVSSFGWSGTNAHCVLKAPVGHADPPVPDDGRLLLLSATSAGALRDQEAVLAQHLRENPTLRLADVARTLDEGRAHMPVRRAWVATGTADAETLLTAGTRDEPRSTDQPRRVAYLLPGVGDHYLAMGRDLYSTEPVFAEVVDRCTALLLSDHGIDLAPVLFADPVPGTPTADPFGRLVPPRATGCDDQTLSDAAMSHPYVFVIELALAAVLEARGVRPAVLLGYSLGEYAAAYLAGVFTLADALSLVVMRARLIASVPHGAMLAVAAPADELSDVVVPGSLAVAALNGPAMTILSGTVDAVTEAAGRLIGRGVAAVRVRSDHAFHSPLLEPLRGELQAILAGLPRSAPRLPIMSNLSGTWLTEEEATSAEYWADHLCLPVDFMRGAAEFRRHADVFVEVGPGMTLTALLRQNGLAGPDDVVTTLGSPDQHAVQGAGEHLHILRALGDLWERGVAEPGHGDGGDIVSLPTYQFQRSRYWPERDRRVTVEDNAEENTDVLHTYVPAWIRDDVRHSVEETDRAGGRYLILADPGGIGTRLATRLRAGQGTVLEVLPGERYGQAGDRYVIDPGDADHYRRVVAELEPGTGPITVVHLWSLVADPLLVGLTEHADATIDSSIRHGFDSLLHLAQALGGSVSGQDLRLLTVSAGSAEVVGGDATAPERAAVHGFGRSLTHEFAGAKWAGVDLDDDGALDAVDQLADEVWREVRLLRHGQLGTGPLIAWRRGRRWTRSWRSGTQPAGPAADGHAWRRDGVYLITGGTRGLGLALARQLAGAGVRGLALLGRRSPAPVADLAALRTSGDERFAETARVMAELVQLGVEVIVLSADAGQPDDLRAAFRRARDHFGALHGIVHAAGVPGGGLVQHKTVAGAEIVLGPKIRALGPILELIGPACPPHERLDLVLFYSSVVGEIGGPGESDYAAANVVLDAFAAATDDPHGTRICSLVWGPWKHDAWQAAALAHSPALADAVREYRDRHGIDVAGGTACAVAAAAEGRSTVMVVGESLNSLRRRWGELHAPAAAVPVAGSSSVPGMSGYARPALRQAYVAPRTPLEHRVALVWTTFLGISGIGVHDPFFDLGGNSLIGMSIVRALEEQLQANVPPAALFEHPTVAELAARLGGEPVGVTLQVAGDRGRQRRQARTGSGDERKRGGAA